jgi:hypothetical protein
MAVVVLVFLSVIILRIVCAYSTKKKNRENRGKGGKRKKKRGHDGVGE